MKSSIIDSEKDILMNQAEHIKKTEIIKNENNVNLELFKPIRAE